MSPRQEIIFWGASGQARVLRECLGGTAHLVALFDNAETVESPFGDVPLVGGQRQFESWVKQRTGPTPLSFLVAIGGDKGRARCELQTYLTEHGLLPHRAIHRTAFVAHNAVIGVGTQILAQAAVCVDAVMGNACIVNTAATVDHECRLGQGVHLAPGAHLAGCVEVGDYALIGTGAIVLPRIKIGEGAVVGAGAVVTRDVPAHAIVVGNPARALQSTR